MKTPSHAHLNSNEERKQMAKEPDNDRTYRIKYRCANCGDTWIAEVSYGISAPKRATCPNCGVDAGSPVPLQPQ